MRKAWSALGLAGWILISFAASLPGRWFPPGAWYAALEKPAFTPPAWLFGPVWTLLYAAMGVAAWLVWRTRGFSGAGGALALFFTQLALNALWTVLFFGLRAPGLALAEILVLSLAIGATTIAFWRHHPLAGALLVPYWLWVTFAAALNLRIWQLN